MHKFHLTVSLLMVVLVVSPISHGQLYKWVDAQGNVHYGDSPPENANLKRITGKVSSFRSVSVEPFKFNPDLISRRKESTTVVMYSTSWCGYCKKAANHFRSNKIPFTEYDIETDKQAAQEYKDMKGRGVPIILIGDQRMNGFNAVSFDKIYYDKS